MEEFKKHNSLYYMRRCGSSEDWKDPREYSD